MNSASRDALNLPGVSHCRSAGNQPCGNESRLCDLHLRMQRRNPHPELLHGSSLSDRTAHRCRAAGQLEALAGIRDLCAVHLQDGDVAAADHQWPVRGVQGRESTEIVINPTCTGSVRLQNCDFWGPAVQNVVSHGKSFVSLSNCYFSSGRPNNPGKALVEADGGKLQVQGCSFATPSRRSCWARGSNTPS